MCRAGRVRILDLWSPRVPSTPAGSPRNQGPDKFIEPPPPQTCGTEGGSSLFPKTFSPRGIWTISLGNSNKKRALQTDSRADKLAFERERDTDLL